MMSDGLIFLVSKINQMVLDVVKFLSRECLFSDRNDHADGVFLKQCLVERGLCIPQEQGMRALSLKGVQDTAG